MSDPRLQHKVGEARAMAERRGVDLAGPTLLATFELPIWGAHVAAHEIGELARMPGTAVAAVSSDCLPEVRAAVEGAPRLHVVAERGLVCGLSGGAVVHVYPTSVAETTAFAAALFSGVAPHSLRVALSCCVSSGRQEAVLEGRERAPVSSARELLADVERRKGVVSITAEDALLVEDSPATLEAVRETLACDHPGRFVRVVRLPSGRFRMSPAPAPREVAREELHVIAREIAISCDRYLESRGSTTFGFATEPVARWEYGPERGARALATEVFGGDTPVTHLGLAPFEGEGTLFFAYEGSDAVWEAVNKDLPYVTVRDILEYARILRAIRRGE